MSTEIIKLAKDALLDELTSAQIYRKIAKLQRQKEIKQKLETIAKIEEEHAEYWKRFLEKRGQKTEDIKPSNLKTIPYTLLLRILGLGLTLKLLEIGEREAV
ncbi:rubrerythrin family protein, partial [Candidatus Woesearchaeota archaeon]